MPDLILRSGKRAGRRVSIPGAEAILGRDEACKIRLTSSEVSRQHCKISVSGEKLTVTDLDSRNGTYVNDVRIGQLTELKPGDLLRVGPFIMQVPGYTERADASPDDTIAGWLSDDVGGQEAAASGDTAFIAEYDPPGRDSREISELRLGANGPAQSHSQPKVAAPPPPVDPLVQQASEIIREHWADLKK